MEPFGVQVKNYKSFTSEASGFEAVYPINVIIGRNNTGKSALLDIVGFVAQPSIQEQTAEVLISKALTEAEIDLIFDRNTGGGPINGNWNQYGRNWIGKTATIRLGQAGRKLVSIEEANGRTMDAFFNDKIAGRLTNVFENKSFRRLLADRDISPEPDNQPELQPNGSGATNLIQRFIIQETLDNTLVEKTLLEALNKIFAQDGKFTRITARRLNNGNYEIFLEEENKGLISLSNSGSGLKTIILCLCNLLLIPALEGRPIEDYMFGFEELENNLHPGLQRRLLSYLNDFAIENKVKVFLTTHSNVVIDLFSRSENAQIIHVKHDGKSATSHTVESFTDSSGLLDDLEVRASDLLQSNGVIWVEGPSDRIYINRWIELLSGGVLREGLHYQIVYYGGRLLSHFGADGIDEETLDVLKVNRNTVMVIDSDKRAAQSHLNATKKRVISEIESVGGYVWVTQGKEIENYIHADLINKVYSSKSLLNIGQYQLFDEYVEENISADEARRFLRDKVAFAEKLKPLMSKETMDVLDLNKQMTAILARIHDWNSGRGDNIR